MLYNWHQIYLSLQFGGIRICSILKISDAEKNKIYDNHLSEKNRYEKSYRFIIFNYRHLFRN